MNRTLPPRVFVRALLALVMLDASFVFGQGGNRGAIIGSIKDTSGAVIPGVNLEIINDATSVTERKMPSGTDGSFAATLLSVGHYRVTHSTSHYLQEFIQLLRQLSVFWYAAGAF
jgi:Carboxypeptidase regulatory-like domain